MLRPVVPITPVGDEVGQTVSALVDSGSEHILAAPWIARAVGLDPGSSARELTIGIGGESVRVRFIDMTLRLHPPAAGDEEYVEWSAEVGLVGHWKPTWPMLVGQVGFFSQFTVQMSRHAQRLAVEDFDAFDKRHGIRYLNS